MPEGFLPVPDFIKKDEVDEALDLFEQQQCGLSKHEVMKEPIYLHLSLDDLKKKSPEELSEASYLLAQYSFSLQRSINRLHSWKKWSDAKMLELVGSEIDKIGNNYGYNERMIVVKSKSEICRKLNGFIRELEMKISRLFSTPEHVKIISDAIKDLKYAAIRREKSYSNE